MHILIESRCLRLIQSSKLGPSVGSSLQMRFRELGRKGRDIFMAMVTFEKMCHLQGLEDSEL